VTHLYAAYGALVRSNRPLDALREVPEGEADIEVEFAEGAPPEVDEEAAATSDATGFHSTHRRPDGGWLYRLASHGGARAWTMSVGGDGGAIELRWRGDVPVADIAAFVETAGLAAALTLRRTPLLHGCALARGDAAAFVVVGASGAGKSSLAATALAGGHTVVSDDIAALGDGPDGLVVVHSGGRTLRLHADTARAIGREPEALERVFADEMLPPKLFTWLPDAEPRERPVASIFALSGTRASHPRIERASPAEALPLLLRNTYGDSAADPPLRATLLPFWTRLAREVPVHVVTPPDRLGALPSFVDALTDAAMLPQPCGPPSSSSGRPAP
jgi:hypothetical protein